MKLRPSPNGAGRKPWHTDEYVAYLQSPQWAAVRRAALERAGHRCENVYVSHRVVRQEDDVVWTKDEFEYCPNTTDLEVHHLTYERLGAEAWGDLIVLCRDHHAAADRRRQHSRRRR